MMQQSPLEQALLAADLAYSEPARSRRLATAALAAAALAAAALGGSAADDVASAAHRALGMAAAATGDLTEAATRLRHAVALGDAAGLPLRAGQARGSLAYVLMLTGSAGDALRELDRADVDLRDGKPAARVQMQRGIVLSEVRRFDDAAVSLERALDTLRRAGGGDLLEADIRNNRAIVALGIGDWAVAHDQLRRAEILYTGAGHPGRTAMVLHNRALVEGLQGNVPAALATFDAAGRRYREAGLHPGLLEVERAETLLGVGLVAEARQAAADAVDGFDRQRNVVDLVQARLVLAEAALRDGDPVTALVESDRARRGARRQQRPRWAALAGHLRVQARWRAGDRSVAAVRAGARTADELAAAGWPAQSLDVHLVVGRTALALGRTGLARDHLLRAGAARHTGLAEVRVRGWHAEALLRDLDGDPPGAARAVRTGLTLVDRFQAGLGATDLRAHAASHSEDLARLGVRLAVDTGRPMTLLAAAERRRAGSLRSRPVRPPDDDALAADLAALRRLTDDRRTGDLDDTRALDARRGALERAIRARAWHAAGAGTPEARAFDPRRLRAALGRTVLVEFVEHDGVLLAVTVTAERVRCDRLGAVDAVAAATDALRTALRFAGDGVGSARAAAAVRGKVAQHAATLDALLLAPLATGDAGRPLVIVPTGVLHGVPWSALPSCSPRAVTVAPSAALWLRAANRPDPTTAGRTVLAHGPGLPHAAAEVADLARLLPGAQTLVGARAEVAPVLDALDGADTAHLAAHGRFRADNPMFSALQFADGPMTVHDLERLTAPPRLVVLAGCDSARAGVRSGDELLGLAAALLAMGTRTLVAAAVPVPDDASRALMVRFHRFRTTGLGAAEALRQARTDPAATSADPTPTLDVAAAGFVCLGAG